MEKLTSEVLKTLTQKAYETAKKQGFYPENTSIPHCLMMIITEMGETIQADRKGKHGAIKDYEAWIDTSSEHAYENTLADTMESELADVAIRIMSLVGYLINEKKQGRIVTDEIFYYNYDFCKECYLKDSLTEDLFFLIQVIVGNDIAHAPTWLVVLKLQEVLAYLFALAHRRDIDILEHIKLKMQFNECREYKHGYKY